jgi:hypothetical protein
VSDSPTGDEDVFGPAPLQNVDGPDEIFVGTTLANSDSNLKRRIDDASRALEDFAIIAKEDKARMQQKEALPTGSFASMQQTEYAWALAFPTLFLPTYVNGKWVMLGDLTPPLLLCAPNRVRGTRSGDTGRRCCILQVRWRLQKCCNSFLQLQKGIMASYRFAQCLLYRPLFGC